MGAETAILASTISSALSITAVISSRKNVSMNALMMGVLPNVYVWITQFLVTTTRLKYQGKCYPTRLC